MVIRIKDLAVSRTNYKFGSHVAPGVHLGIDPFNVLTPVLRVSSLVGDSGKFLIIKWLGFWKDVDLF